MDEIDHLFLCTINDWHLVPEKATKKESLLHKQHKDLNSAF